MKIRTAPMLYTVAVFLAAAITLAGCGVTASASHGSAKTLAAWLHQGGKSRIFRLATDINTVNGAIDSYSDDPGELAGSCRRLHHDAAAAEAFPQISRTRVQARWHQSLTLLAHGSAACSRVSGASPTAVIQVASTDLSDATNTLSDVIAAAAQITPMSSVWDHGD